MFEIDLFTQLSTRISPELLFTAGGFAFNILVLPTLLNANAAIPRIQSVLSVVVLIFFFTIPYLWIGYYYSALANIIGAVLWTTVALYRAPQTTPTTEPTPTASPQHAD